jgi:hypothetical protein
MRKLLVVGAVQCVLVLWIFTSLVGGVGTSIPDKGIDLDAVCSEVVTRPPDWVFVFRQRTGDARNVSFRDLPFHQGDTVAVVGFLRPATGAAVLYASRESASSTDAQGTAQDGLTIRLDQLDLAWVVREAPWDRCARAEGRCRLIASGHTGMEIGDLTDVQRLEVWSKPHRPLPVIR